MSKEGLDEMCCCLLLFIQVVCLQIVTEKLDYNMRNTEQQNTHLDGFSIGEVPLCVNSILNELNMRGYLQAEHGLIGLQLPEGRLGGVLRYHRFKITYLEVICCS